MFERRQSVRAIRVEFAMGSIVQAEDISCGCSTDRLAPISISPRMGGNRFQPWNQPFCRLGLPVARNQGPHDDLLTEPPRGRNHPRIAKAPGRPEPVRRLTRGCGDGVVTATELDEDVIWAEPEQIGMRVGVVPDDMAASSGFLDDFRMISHEFSDDEKRGVGVVAVKKIEQLWRDGRIRSVVKG